jgi:ribose transport system substrate-binding protein
MLTARRCATLNPKQSKRETARNSSLVLARSALALATALLIVTTFVECKRSRSNPSLRSGEPHVSAVNRPDVKLGVSLYAMQNPYFAAQLGSVKREAAALGIAEVISTDAQDDIQKQIADVEDLLARGIDLLILDPKDPKALLRATEAAAQANVPVIIMDSSIDPSATVVTTVQSNNMANGEMVGEWIARRLAGQQIKMGLISGTPGNPVGKDRRDGVFLGIIEQQVRDHNQTSFEIVSQGWGNWANDGGLKAGEDILTAHPDINLMLCENDAMCLGAIKAIKARALTDKILIAAAADGQKEALELIQQGKYGATGSNDPELTGKTAVDLGVKYLNGARDIPRISFTPAAAITQENVQQFYRPNAVF